MKELSKNACKLLLAIGEGDKRDVGAYELGMTNDEFIDACEELRIELLLDHLRLSEKGTVDIMGVKLQSPTLTTKGKEVFKEHKKISICG